MYIEVDQKMRGQAESRKLDDLVNLEKKLRAIPRDLIRYIRMLATVNPARRRAELKKLKAKIADTWTVVVGTPSSVIMVLAIVCYEKLTGKRPKKKPPRPSHTTPP